MSGNVVWGQVMQCYDGTNDTAIRHIHYNHIFYYMITKPGVQVQYPSKLGQAWAEQVHAREVDLLWLTCSMDEAGLEQSEVPAKLPDHLF